LDALRRSRAKDFEVSLSPEGLFRAFRAYGESFEERTRSEREANRPDRYDRRLYRTHLSPSHFVFGIADLPALRDKSGNFVSGWLFRSFFTRDG